MPQLWVIVLFLIGILLILLEVVVPGGVLGIIGGIAAIAAIVFAFEDSLWAGLVMTAFTGTVIPLSLYFGLRRLALRKRLSIAEGSTVGAEKFAALSGKTGVTLTPLRPSGMARIEGQRVDVITDGNHLGVGVSVRVVRVEGNKVVVEALRQSPE